jgi:hypothetical protein
VERIDLRGLSYGKEKGELLHVIRALTQSRVERSDLRGWVVGKKAAVNFHPRRSDLAPLCVAHRG